MKIPARCSSMFGLALCLAAAGCNVLGVHKEVGKLERHGIVTVRVKDAARVDPKVHVYTVAWVRTGNGKPRTVGLQRVLPGEIAAFGLYERHVFSVGAFADENGNGHYDSGEPLAQADGVRPLALDKTGVRARPVELVLRCESPPYPGTAGAIIPGQDDSLGKALPIAQGTLASLDEPRFAADAGSEGLWRPLGFLSDNASGIYFLEPYDARRIPVVFVYGIGGSPQDWRYAMEHLDRKRFQAWFYHYPSGLRLDRSSNGLAQGLCLLKERLGFERCYVVAHSMGGLVSYVAVQKAAAWEGKNFIPAFVTVSTPWGGHAAAQMGVRRMRKPVPSWIDVCPGSEYLAGIYATPLPAGTRHVAMYGSIPDGPAWLGKPNDGVVTLKSETEPRVLDRAVMKRGYDYGHVEILKQERVLRDLEKQLALETGNRKPETGKGIER